MTRFEAFKVIISVDQQASARLLVWPPGLPFMAYMLDSIGTCLEDGWAFSNVPTEPGVYLCLITDGWWNEEDNSFPIEDTTMLTAKPLAEYLEAS